MNASGRIFTFDGFLKVMKQSESESGGGDDKILPALEVGQVVDVKSYQERARDEATRAIH